MRQNVMTTTTITWDGRGVGSRHLIGEFFYYTTSTSESLRLAGAFSRFSLNHAGHNKHQRVLRTHWHLLPRQRQPQWAPTSHNNLLVPFSLLPRWPQPAPTSPQDLLVASPSTTQAPTSHYDLLVFFSVMITSDGIYFFSYKYFFFISLLQFHYYIVFISLLIIK